MRKNEQELTTQQLIGNLVKVGHKSLDPYISDGLKVVSENPDLFAHLIAWNQVQGEIRDSKVALPVLSLRGEAGNADGFPTYRENAIAHLLLLDPKNLCRAVVFHKLLTSQGFGVSGGAGYAIKGMVEQYLRSREVNETRWDSVVLQHKKSIKALYAYYHLKPTDRTQSLLFDKKAHSAHAGGKSVVFPENSVFGILPKLVNMPPKEAALAIKENSIPFMTAIGALGGLSKSTDLVLALIGSMSGNELITNSNMLQKLGVMANPKLKKAFDEAVLKAQSNKKTLSLKAGRASSFIKDERIKASLEKLQDAKIDDLSGMEGDWLVLGDMSGSMSLAIEKAKEIAAFLCRVAKGKVYLVFFNTIPVFYDVSGNSLEEIKKKTSGVRASGATRISCGLEYISEKDLIVNGIAIVSDGGENREPTFLRVYKEYEKKFMISPTVYLLHLDGDPDTLSGQMKHLPYQMLEVKDIDYYGLPNLAKLLRTSRFTLLDEIMQTPLLRVQDVLHQ
jgi:hypothetical protein